MGISCLANGQESNPETVVREAKSLADETTKNIAGIRQLFASPLVSEEKFIGDLREHRAISSRLFGRIRSIISKCDIAISQIKVNINQINQQIYNIDDLADDDKAQLSSPTAQDHFAMASANAANALTEALAQQKDIQAQLDELKRAGTDVDAEKAKWDDAIRALVRVTPAGSDVRENAVTTLASMSQNLKTHFENLRRLEQQIPRHRRAISTYQRIMTSYKAINAQAQYLSTIHELVSSLQNGQADLESEINKIDERFVSKINDTRTRDTFTAITTAIFGIAVIIVIVFFFRLANNDDARAALFQNDSGLQFVTLFSIVIAIILFGVLKILEGKELAALLGGLSGYILGRGSISQQSGQRSASSPQQQTRQAATNPQLPQSPQQAPAT
jgi:hypothetical protein